MVEFTPALLAGGYTKDDASKINDILSQGFFVLNKDESDFIIYGPASVEIVDGEGDLIKIEAFDKALPQLLRRARLTLNHEDTIIGEILPEYEHLGKVYETGVQGDKFYVVGKIWNDTAKANETRKRISEGLLRSYSISGEGFRVQTKLDQEDGTAYREIPKIDLSAITVCERGMNQEAHFEVIRKKMTDDNLLDKCPTCGGKKPKKTEEHKMVEEKPAEVAKTEAPTPPARDLSKEFDDYKTVIDTKFADMLKAIEALSKAKDDKDEDEEDDEDKPTPADEEKKQKSAVEVAQTVDVVKLKEELMTDLRKELLVKGGPTLPEVVNGETKSKGFTLSELANMSWKDVEAKLK